MSTNVQLVAQTRYFDFPIKRSVLMFLRITKDRGLNKIYSDVTVLSSTHTSERIDYHGRQVIEVNNSTLELPLNWQMAGDSGVTLGPSRSGNDGSNGPSMALPWCFVVSLTVSGLGCRCL